MQDRQPDQPRNLDDARVAQELGEVAPHRCRVGASGVPRLHRTTAVAGARPCACAGSGATVIAYDLMPNSNGDWRCVSANFITSKRTHGLIGSEGGAPRPITPLPCSVQAPRRRLMISGSLSKRT